MIGEVDDGGLRGAGFEIEDQRVAVQRIGGDGIDSAGIALVAIGGMDGEADRFVRTLNIPAAVAEIVRPAVKLVLAHVGGELVLCAVEHEAGIGDAACDAADDGACRPVACQKLLIRAAARDEIDAIHDD